MSIDPDDAEAARGGAETPPAPPPDLDVVHGFGAEEFVVDEQHDEDPWPHFVRAWLIAQRAPNTAKAYATAELQWREYCHDRGLHPLAARRGDVDSWKQRLAAHGGFHGRPASA